MTKKQLDVLAIVIAKWSDYESDVYYLAKHFDMELPETGVKRGEHHFRIEAIKYFDQLKKLKQEYGNKWKDN